MEVQDRMSVPTANGATHSTVDFRKTRLHLNLPESRLSSSEALERDESPPDEDHGAIELPEEDANSIIGVSIGRAQTRLTSPRTPAAEKAAALEDKDGGGLFDGAGDENADREEEGLSHHGYFTQRQSVVGKQTTLPDPKPVSSLPSPWRAVPRVFQIPSNDDRDSRTSGTTSMLLDLNFKRYMSNFNLPSLPKTTSFKEFSLPSMSSFLSNTRSRSPAGKERTRQKRASTLATPVLAKSPNGLFSGNTSLNTQNDLGTPMAGHSGIDPNSSIAPLQSPLLRRTNSDQSVLRRVTSTGSSLGDDSRWENVQEQVNSRMKAIKDSLQDSSIKIPSLPSISSLNLSSFRPDFTRGRAHSDARHPNGEHTTLDNANSATDRHTPAASGDSGQQSDADVFQLNGKTVKHTHSYLEQALEHLTGDLVIMGGYRGSILRSSKPPYRQLWVPVKVGLNIRRVNLEVGLQPEDEERMEENIFASGMLSHIGPVDMGRRLLKRLQKCKNTQEGRLRVHDYGYDWRLSPDLLSRKLIEFLDALPSNASNVPKGQTGAILISHSMGGLITRHAVNQRPELFAGVVYAGVPQHCVNILGPLRNGDDVLLSSKVLTAQVNFTLRGSFLLLPADGKCFVNKETREAYPVNFFDVEEWKKYAWSPCIAPALPPIHPPEQKTILGSMAEMLPSLPLPSRKVSVSQTKDEVSNTANSTSRKMTNLTSPTTAHALNPQLSPPLSVPTNGNTPQCTIPLADALAYLQRTLAATLVFKSQLAHNPVHTTNNLYPPLAVLYANNTPTVSAARVSSREAIRHSDAYDDLQFGSGDGVCLARAAMLPEGYTCARGGKVRTERGHVGLLGDLEAVGKCLLAVMEGRRQGTGLGLDEKLV